MIPEIELLNEARAHLELALAPAGAESVKRTLFPLALVLQLESNPENLTAEQERAVVAARFDEYGRLLEHVPVDILKAAGDAHVLKSKFFPAISELMEFARPKLEERQRQHRRVGLLIEARNRPRKPEPPKFEQEPEDVRLLAVLKWLERPGSNLYNPSKAREVRARLAELGVDAGEAPLEVTHEAPSKEPPAKIGTFKSAHASVPRGGQAITAPRAAAATLRARAKFWREQGRVEHADKLEADAEALDPRREPQLEPPPPEEIPE